MVPEKMAFEAFNVLRSLNGERSARETSHSQSHVINTWFKHVEYIDKQ
jgi:hypothetical protein